MPNYYPPTNPKVKNVLGDTAIITWDVHNAIEFKAGTKYKIYTSPDDSVYTLDQTVARPEAAIRLIASNKYVRIASLVVMLGESDKSAALIIMDPVTLSRYEDPTPVAVDDIGKSRYLKIGSDGKLEVRAEITDSILIDTSAQVQEQVDLLTAIKGLMSPGAAKEVKQDDIILRLIDQADILAEIRTNTQVGNLKISDVVTGLVGTAGVKVTLPFWARANIRQITAILESGSATAFHVNVWRLKLGSSERDIIAKFNSYEENRLDVIKAIPYINLDALEEITLEIIPDAGVNNIFYVRIAGELAF